MSSASRISFLSSIDPQARERVSRIRLNMTDASYFDRTVLKRESVQPTAASHRLIGQALRLHASMCRKYCSPATRRTTGMFSIDGWRFSEHRAIVILLKVPTEANAYKMFETLNDRGLRTSQADLVKNYLFGESGDRLPRHSRSGLP